MKRITIDSEIEEIVFNENTIELSFNDGVLTINSLTNPRIIDENFTELDNRLSVLEEMVLNKK